MHPKLYAFIQDKSIIMLCVDIEDYLFQFWCGNMVKLAAMIL